MRRNNNWPVLQQFGLSIRSDGLPDAIRCDTDQLVIRPNGQLLHA